MAKRNAIEPETRGVPGWEVEPPPAMAEGYTWCPECQAAFEGDVCPGCAPGRAEVEVEFTGLETERPPKTLEDVQKTVEAMELDVKTRNTTESLKCILTDDEIRRYGIAQARANAEIARAEEELQSVKSQYKSRIDAAAATRNDMAQRINNGYEFRQVECIERWDYGSNVITVLRTDTYETVSRRIMTRDEMQRKLF